MIDLSKQYGQRLRALNITSGGILAEPLGLALTPWKRMRGLLARPCLKDLEGLLLQPCNSVHMFFMKYAIDVVFLDTQNKVVGLKKGLKPWHIATCFLAHSTLELVVGQISATKTNLGDLVVFEPVQW